MKQVSALLGLCRAAVDGRLPMIREHLGASNRYEITLQARAAGYLKEGEAA
jgi:hypothetical protein